MPEDFLTRAWADGHKHFSDQIAAAFSSAWRTIGVGLERLNRYEFDAPWKHEPCGKR